MLYFALLILFWSIIIFTLWLWKHTLLKKTWHEPYLSDFALIIESDDWGVGEAYHLERLSGINTLFQRYSDHVKRPAVLTANMVLSLPDTISMQQNCFNQFERKTLSKNFITLLNGFKHCISQGTFIPQIHGIEHYYAPGLLQLAQQNDPRVTPFFNQPDWTDWEALDSPLQGHYVNGTQLPTEPVSKQQQQLQYEHAQQEFFNCFNFNSKSIVAPCYLWDNTSETVWAEHEQTIQYIQTAGYRCNGRDQNGHYHQDIRLIRSGDKTEHGALYLVRNAMYEPADGRKAQDCIKQIIKAFRQGEAATISTHRYNYTRSEEIFNDSIKGLETLLFFVTGHYGKRLRFLSSPELGQWLENPEQAMFCDAQKKEWPALQSLGGLGLLNAFLWRLWYRHQKLRLLSIVTALVIPWGILLLADKLLNSRNPSL